MRGFTLIELMFTVSILGFFFAIFFGLITQTTRSLASINEHCENNDTGGYSAVYITEKSRLAHTYTITDSGRKLTLKFDDQPSVDSNSDQDFYNDEDRIETFTHIDNKIEHSNSTITRVIAENVKELPGKAIFNVANNSRPELIDLNFVVANASSNKVERNIISTSIFINNYK